MPRAQRRVDPATIIACTNAAGFVLEARSDLLRNSDNDYSKGVFEPILRGKADRFVMRLTKAD